MPNEWILHGASASNRLIYRPFHQMRHDTSLHPRQFATASSDFLQVGAITGRSHAGDCLESGVESRNLVEADVGTDLLQRQI